MFAAKDEAGRLVYAKLISDIDRNYFCTDCNQPVRLVIKKSQKYFCHTAKRYNSKNETTIHKKSKLLLKQDFEKLNYNTDTEIYTSDNQRIDLLVSKNERQIAVEFQRSPITDKSFVQRVRGYEKSGYQNFWILGMNYFTKKPNWRQLKFLNFSRFWQWYLIFFDADRHLYKLMYKMEFFGVMNNVSFCLHNFSNLEELHQFRPTDYEQSYTFCKKYTDAFKRFCYQKQVNYLKLESVTIQMPPIIKDNLVWTIKNYQKLSSVDDLIRIPAQIKIKPQLAEVTIAEVQDKLNMLLAMIE